MQEKVILFGNGSFYSIAVLDNLLSWGITPISIALPEFPPSTHNNKVSAIDVEQGLSANKLTETASRFLIPLVYAPRALSASLPAKLAAFKADYILVACWPYLLAPAVIDSISKAALNLHPSLLPKYRGVAPVAEQLANRETHLGVTLHRLSQQYDCGDIVAQASFVLENTEASHRQIEAQAALAGTTLFVEHIAANEGAG
jgi:methionyl-tRNA formyltransferase